ncbi:MAG: terminase large subunit domain-containing protein, partial [Stellaceae bacterium]
MNGDNPSQSLAERLANKPDAEWLTHVDRADRAQHQFALDDWELWARPNQLPPLGDWRVWLLLAGRGFGKTRSGAEFVRARVEAGLAARVALVGPTAADVRDVMIEGESGLLAISRDDFRPLYEPSKRRLAWPNGAVALAFSADEPERLRGPQHDLAWCDELASWRYAAAWDNLLLGLRLGADPRAVVTTTPRPTKLVRDVLASPGTIVMRGSTFDNALNLAPSFLESVVRRYRGTRLGRQ